MKSEVGISESNKNNNEWKGRTRPTEIWSPSEAAPAAKKRPMYSYTLVNLLEH